MARQAAACGLRPRRLIVDWLYGRQVVRLACAGGAKRRPRTLAGTAEGLAWLAAHAVAAAACRPRRLDAHRPAAAHRQPRAPGPRLPGRRLPLRARPATLLAARPAGRARRGHRPAQPGRRRAQRPGGRRRRPRAAASPRGRGHAGRRQGRRPAPPSTSPSPTSTNVVAFLAECKQAGHWVYGAAGDAGRALRRARPHRRVALVFGAEGRGLRPLVRRACDELGAIPMEGPVGSLNVSVAAALFLYEARRPAPRRGRGGAARVAPAPPARRRPASRLAGPARELAHGASSHDSYIVDGYNVLHALFPDLRRNSSTTGAAGWPTSLPASPPCAAPGWPGLRRPLPAARDLRAARRHARRGLLRRRLAVGRRGDRAAHRRRAGRRGHRRGVGRLRGAAHGRPVPACGA